jgi:hypothetical protein
MQHWIDRSGIAHRPMLKLGMTSEEIAETKGRALSWGLATGAVREVVQAYARAWLATVDRERALQTAGGGCPASAPKRVTYHSRSLHAEAASE